MNKLKNTTLLTPFVLILTISCGSSVIIYQHIKAKKEPINPIRIQQGRLTNEEEERYLHQQMEEKRKQLESPDWTTNKKPKSSHSRKKSEKTYKENLYTRRTNRARIIPHPGSQSSKFMFTEDQRFLVGSFNNMGIYVFDMQKYTWHLLKEINAENIPFSVSNGKLIIYSPDDDQFTQYSYPTFKELSKHSYSYLSRPVGLHLIGPGSNTLLVTTEEARKVKIIKLNTENFKGEEYDTDGFYSPSSQPFVEVQNRAFSIEEARIQTSNHNNWKIKFSNNKIKLFSNSSVALNNSLRFDQRSLYFGDNNRAAYTGEQRIFPSLNGNVIAVTIPNNGYSSETPRNILLLETRAFKSILKFSYQINSKGTIQPLEYNSNPSFVLLQTSQVVTIHEKHLTIFSIPLAENISPDCLVVSSFPPAPALAGEKFEHQILVLSGTGEAVFNLIEGPQNLSLSKSGKISWKAPKNRAHLDYAIIQITNNTGASIYHILSL